jgi:cobalamin biosynthesis protein CobT
MKPSVKHFRVLRCLAFVHVPDVQRKKLDNKSIKCVHLGISDESKAYKLFNPIDKKIIVSRDVVFDESKGHNWGETSAVQKSQNQNDFDDETVDNEETEEVEDTQANGDAGNNDTIANTDATNEEVYESEEELGPRVGRRPAYLNDYVIGQELDEQAELHNLAVFSSNNDSVTFDEAVKLEVWRKAMDQEIESIEKNDTWELTSLPKRVKKIGVHMNIPCL